MTRGRAPETQRPPVRDGRGRAFPREAPRAPSRSGAGLGAFAPPRRSPPVTPPRAPSPSRPTEPPSALHIIPQRVILQLAKLQIRRAPPKLARQARSPRARRRAAAGSAARRARGSRLGADGPGGVHRSATSQRRWCSLGSWPRCPAGPSARAGGLARRHVRAGCSWVVRPPGWSRSWSPRGRASGALPATGPRVDKTDVILQRAEY